MSECPKDWRSGESNQIESDIKQWSVVGQRVSQELNAYLSFSFFLSLRVAIERNRFCLCWNEKG